MSTQEGQSPAERMRAKHMKKRLMALALCLLLPIGAQAVEEGVVEDAPMVAIDASAFEMDETSYLPDESYYALDVWEPAWATSEEYVPAELSYGMYEDVSQSPRLMPGEIARAKKLAQAYREGKVTYTGESVLEKMENVVLGVYALNPDDFSGEHAFVLLPGTCLTDEQLLAIIDAFSQMGLEFDPETLNYRNCARGGGIETTRFFASEEKDRFSTLVDKVRRGIIVPDASFDGLVRVPKLDNSYYCGMTDFLLMPHHSLTDEELLSLAVGAGYHNESDEYDLDEIERRSRNALYQAFHTPLSMELSGVFTEGSSMMPLFNAECEDGWDFDSEARWTFGANFSYAKADGVEVHAYTYFDRESGELLYASAIDSRDLGDASPEEREVTQAEIDAAIALAQAQLGMSELDWHVLEMECSTNWGLCLQVRAQVAQDMWITLFIGKDDGQTHGWSLERGTLVEALPSNDDHNG